MLECQKMNQDKFAQVFSILFHILTFSFIVII